MTDDVSVLVRTSFGPRSTWDTVRAGFETPSPDGFLPGVRSVDDPAMDGLAPEQVLRALPEGSRAVVFIADEKTDAGPEPLVLAVLPGSDPLQSFRLPLTEAWSVENNLSLANMDWSDFAGAVDETGVFRGF